MQLFLFDVKLNTIAKYWCPSLTFFLRPTATDQGITQVVVVVVVVLVLGGLLTNLLNIIKTVTFRANMHRITIVQQFHR